MIRGTIIAAVKPPLCHAPAVTAWLLALLAAVTLNCNAQQALVPTKLELTPSICLLDAGEDACRETIEVQWHSLQSLSACLFLPQSRPQALQCWQDTSNGEHHTPVIAQTDQRFELRSSLDDTLLASRSLEVVRAQQRLRNRRRNPWSFF